MLGISDNDANKIDICPNCGSSMGVLVSTGYECKEHKWFTVEPKTPECPHCFKPLTPTKYVYAAVCHCGVIKPKCDWLTKEQKKIINQMGTRQLCFI